MPPVSRKKHHPHLVITSPYPLHFTLRACDRACRVLVTTHSSTPVPVLPQHTESTYAVGVGRLSTGQIGLTLPFTLAKCSRDGPGALYGDGPPYKRGGRFRKVQNSLEATFRECQASWAISARNVPERGRCPWTVQNRIFQMRPLMG